VRELKVDRRATVRAQNRLNPSASDSVTLCQLLQAETTVVGAAALNGMVMQPEQAGNSQLRTSALRG
jgi:hypothetical protein